MNFSASLYAQPFQSVIPNPRISGRGGKSLNRRFLPKSWVESTRMMARFRGNEPQPLQETSSRPRRSNAVWQFSPQILQRKQSIPGSQEIAERSEEHTSDQSRLHLVCRLLLEKKKKIKTRSKTEQYKYTQKTITEQIHQRH